MIHVSDHAVLRYLERAYGVDIEALRAHIAGRVVNAARLGATAVRIDRVKLVLRRNGEDVTVVTALKGHWPGDKPEAQEP